MGHEHNTQRNKSTRLTQRWGKRFLENQETTGKGFLENQETTGKGFLENQETTGKGFLENQETTGKGFLENQETTGKGFLENQETTGKGFLENQEATIFSELGQSLSPARSTKEILPRLVTNRFSSSGSGWVSESMVTVRTL